VRGFTIILAGLAGVGALAFGPTSGYAIPAFSHQIGQACAACHVGSFGPQLTPYGRQFKLNGFSDRQGTDFMPLSVMAEGSWTATAKSQTTDATHGYGGSTNDIAALDQASLFLGGRIADHFGGLAQGTWSNGGTTHRWMWDNTDLRYGREVQLGAVSSVLGISLNNSPTVSDLFNSTPAWGYPYQSSGVAPKPGAGPLIAGGLAQRVAGATAYGQFADHLYAELGGYLPLGSSQMKDVGIKIADGPQLSSLAPYGRVAFMEDGLRQNYAFGVFGLSAPVYPNNVRSNGSDRVTDLGLDANYQWLGNRKHVVTAMASVIWEHQRLSASQSLGNSEKDRSSLTSYRLSSSYYYDQTYGVTATGFATRGSRDALL